MYFKHIPRPSSYPAIKHFPTSPTVPASIGAGLSPAPPLSSAPRSFFRHHFRVVSATVLRVFRAEARLSSHLPPFFPALAARYFMEKETPRGDKSAGRVKRRAMRKRDSIARSGSDLLFRVLRQSTIGASGFHFRVRNGIECFS